MFGGDRAKGKGRTDSGAFRREAPGKKRKRIKTVDSAAFERRNRKIWAEKGKTIVAFEMVKYHNREYPKEIPLRLEEVAAHFDIRYLRQELPYSLHTEYSYGARNFSNVHLKDLDALSGSEKKGVPQLWKDEEWARQFAKYIFEFVKGHAAPSVIEIHPPFGDYTENLRAFVDRYRIFEEMISTRFPSAEILIENRCGAVYQGGKFVLSKAKDLLELAELIEKKSLALRIAFDIPQLYTAHDVTNRSSKQYFLLLEEIKPIRPYIKGVHLWGKKEGERGRRVSHCGDLNSYFEGDAKIKNEFLKSLYALLDDDSTRKLVLEVNSGDADMWSIIRDLSAAQMAFL